MKYFWHKVLLYILFSVLLVSIFFCKKELPKAPHLPAVDPFMLNLTSFEQASNFPLFDSIILNDSVYYNFRKAILSTYYWDSVYVKCLFAPFAVIPLAYYHEPVSLSGNSWEWTITFTDTINTGNYKASLISVMLQNNQVQWSLYLSETGVFTNFLWGVGISDVNGYSGTWTFKESPDSADNLLLIEWKQNSFSKCFNIKKGDSYYNSSISYQISPVAANDSLTLNSVLILSGNSTLEWNTNTYWGHIKNSLLFTVNSNNWHCWKSNYQNKLNCQ
jgi:hypothetical protein